VFFSHHASLPKQLMGVSQLKQAMAWQHVDKVEDAVSPFPPEAPQTEIVPELSPLPSEAVSDKISMSAFEGTFLHVAPRDLGMNTFAICGIVTEVGIEPTVRHGADLGYIPVVIENACGAGDEEAGRRTQVAITGLTLSVRLDPEGATIV
jgi:nicotinamidase-related amidase